jgi:NADH-quinone oxidoreductase subunit A
MLLLQEGGEVAARGAQPGDCDLRKGSPLLLVRPSKKKPIIYIIISRSSSLINLNEAFLGELTGQRRKSVSLFGPDQGLYWLVVYALLAVVTGLLFLVVPLFFAPRRRSAIKEESFEAGQIPPGAKRIRFALQYYAYLLLFLVFDVTVMFLFVWGYYFASEGGYGFFYPLILILLLFPPLIYAVKLTKALGMW